MTPVRAGLVAVAVGSSWLLADVLAWFQLQHSFPSGSGNVVVSFFLLEAVTLAVIVFGLTIFFRFLGATGSEGDYTSLRRIAADALRSKKDRRIGITAAVFYGAFYALVSGIVVYQPGVDFVKTYGVTGTSLFAAPCCSSLGATPYLALYLSPSLHLAVQLIPIDLLFLAVIPMMIGVNVSIATFAYRNRPRARTGAWLGGFGALVALFTSCPTCAGYFLAGAVGGLGATSLAFALAPFQVIFIVVSIPILAASPILATSTLRRAYLGGCPVEGKRVSAAVQAAAP